MPTFQAGLGQMLDGNLVVYEGATIETTSSANAIERVKAWTSTVEVLDGSWLQILYDGKAIASFEPGEF